MAIYRQIQTKTWRRDEWFLDLTPLDKLLFIYLFSNESASVSGLYEMLPLKTMAFETGIEADYICEALARFEEAGKVFCADGWIWVVNLRKYQAHPSPTVNKRISLDVQDMPDGKLKARYLEYYGGIDIPSIPPQGVSIPPGEQEQEREQEQREQEQEREQECEKTPSSASADYQFIRKKWIELFPDKPKPRGDNKSLSGKAKTRLASEHFRNNWEAALVRVSRSSFLVASGFFDLAWFLKNDSNYEKCLNGNYDNRTDSKQGGKRERVTLDSKQHFATGLGEPA